MNFSWAENQLKKGRAVRRASWPVEIIDAGRVLPGAGGEFVAPTTYARTWHLFMAPPPGAGGTWRGGILAGWGGAIGGTADDPKDGMPYAPTVADGVATDWESH